jgi:hypothetical protein
MNSKTDAEWAEIVAKARHTGRMANTLAKALAQRSAHRWRFVDFRGPNGDESGGIVDIVAIRKSSKAPDAGLKKLDLFDVTLIQVKGGTAKNPTADDIARLKLVRDRYCAQAIVLFAWNKDKKVAKFCLLDENDKWVDTTASKLFGKARKAAKS